jgi:hypothetical protein
MCVEAHGHFRTGHCLNDECKTRYTQDWMKGITLMLLFCIPLFKKKMNI